MHTLYTNAADLFARGGWVMWPLLVLSVLAITLMVERAWFFIANNHPGKLSRHNQLMRLLRRGEVAAARQLAQHDRGVYSRIVMQLLDDSASADAGDAGDAGPVSDAAASAAVESQRGRLERFMPTLSTIITAAPMLGILGTVTGIIASFRLLSGAADAANSSGATALQIATDPRQVSAGIAEALLTTAAGLTIALIVLFPYNAFRAQIDRTLSRTEALIAAAQGATRSAERSEQV